MVAKKEGKWITMNGKKIFIEKAGTSGGRKKKPKTLNGKTAKGAPKSKVRSGKSARGTAVGGVRNGKTGNRRGKTKK